MKRTLLATSLFALLLLGGIQSEAQAQFKVGPHAGFNLDLEELYLGANFHFDLPIEVGDASLTGNPSIDFYPFISEGGDIGGVEVSTSVTSLNLDVLYPINVNFGEAYAGGGLNFTRVSAEVAGFSASDSDVGINLKVGALFSDQGAFRPFGEAGITLGGSSSVFARGGIMFSVGG